MHHATTSASALSRVPDTGNRRGEGPARSLARWPQRSFNVSLARRGLTKKSRKPSFSSHQFLEPVAFGGVHGLPAEEQGSVHEAGQHADEGMPGGGGSLGSLAQQPGGENGVRGPEAPLSVHVVWQKVRFPRSNLVRRKQHIVGEKDQRMLTLYLILAADGQLGPACKSREGGWRFLPIQAPAGSGARVV